MHPCFHNSKNNIEEEDCYKHIAASLRQGRLLYYKICNKISSVYHSPPSPHVSPQVQKFISAQRLHKIVSCSKSQALHNNRHFILRRHHLIQKKKQYNNKDYSLSSNSLSRSSAPRKNSRNYGKKTRLLITGMRRKVLSLVMYFSNLRPLAMGRSTSERIISISGPSAFRAPITCRGDLTEVTAKEKIK